MTKLDRAFMKAYGRPWRDASHSATGRSDTPTMVFERGSSVHRVDPAVERPKSAQTQPASGIQIHALPTDEQLHSHAAHVAETADVLPLPAVASEQSIKASVADTAAELRTQWPARFATDTPSLLERVDPPHEQATTARPLSAFAPSLADPEPAAEPVRPQLEVDRFLWPAECDALCAASYAALDKFVSQLGSTSGQRGRRIALVGAQPAAGRTTVAMSLARRAAGAGANWVLIDADFERSELAARLGIVTQLGWSQVLAGEQELGDVIIASVEDHLALVPLEAGSLAAKQLADNYRARAAFDMLAEAYDVVLIDAGLPGASGVDSLAALHQAARFDAAYVVYDGRTLGDLDLPSYCRRLAAAGLPVAGGIENFAAASDELEF